ncbi:hypothetical protein ACVWZW_001283 [Bradyrhizobium sp. F1.13.4]
MKIIDSDVVAIGAASGLVRGKVKALFYRYRSTGGFDYVSDFLISPEARELGPRHGDSGMLWQIADRPEDEKDMRPPEARPLRPLAIEWGAQVFANGNVRSSFSVASALSTVCRLMGVDLVVPGDDSVSGTWGAFGHYSIGRLAVGLVKDAKLKRLLEANIDAISVGLKALGDKDAIKEGTLIESGFVPLADVADIVWKKFPEGHTTQAGKENGVKGGRDVAQAGFRSTGPEHPQHHCDADGAFANYRTLREACLKNSALLSTSAWIAYYEGRGKRSKPDYKSGVLPFRVWQYFEAMRGYAATDLDAFVAAAGTLAHYVGDASQPLHCTSMHDGDEDRLVDGRISKARSRGKNTPVTSYWGEGVHSSYETQMIGYAAAKGELLPEITKNFGDDHGLALVTSGKDAAMALVQLMEDVADTLPPVELIRIFEQKGGFENGTNAFKAEFWKATRDKTGKVMALGARYLAMIWDAAWVAGNGQSNRASDLVERDKEAMKALYEDTDFVPSLTIDQIGTALNAVGSFSANQKPNMIKNAAKKAPKKSAKKTAKKTRASRPRGTDD